MKAYFLVGPTASGKSEVAHILARRMSLPVLSIDSMQVYAGLDIGTAKPGAEERRWIRYFGLDIVEPDEDFSVSQFCRYVDGVAGEFDKGVIVCGGTGLYAKALTDGIVAGPPPDRELRKKWAGATDDGSLEFLRNELRHAAPDVFSSLKDTKNPRRLIRALEWVNAGMTMERNRHADSASLTGIDWPSDKLKKRIDKRAALMFERGLIDETRQALQKYGSLSGTASQAIGYSEAQDVLKGNMSEEEALEKVQSRTRKLAKKQRTWFRNQAEVDWVTVSGSAGAEDLAAQVESSWEANGAVELRIKEGG